MIDSFTSDHAFLSNFHPSPIELQGAIWPTVEHYYQAMKVTVSEVREQVRMAPTPGAAKRLGRTVVLRPDWESIKLAVMRQALRVKFPGHQIDPTLDRIMSNIPPTLSERLTWTAPAALVEGNTWGDRFWGVCGGQGQNWLGHLLMARRAELLVVSWAANPPPW